MKLTLIAATRPNFMKVAPIIRALDSARSESKIIKYRLVHTGQHYDHNMSDTFFDDLMIPKPDAELGCGGGTHAEQTAAIMVAFERELLSQPTDLVIVVGDVTSTMACALVAKKLNIKVAHVEAGLRSFDLTMPEEINRMVTDRISDLFFTTSQVANQNLLNEGVKEDCIFFVGNVMIDSLLANRARFKKPAIFNALTMQNKEYFVLTMHRPGNVDEVNKLGNIINEIVANTHEYPIIFPVHPRTALLLKELENNAPKLYIIEPMGYLEFNYLVENAKAVITDSGGITEETTVMGVPCLTLRDNTERPETITIGTNKLIGTNPVNIKPAFEELFNGNWKKGDIPELWDGKSAPRIVEALLQVNI